MPADEVLAVVAWLREWRVTYQVNGGWAVDALVGRQTRAHGDVDVFLDATALAPFLGWLTGRGYTVTEDWLPIRIELASSVGRVDAHPMEIGGNGDGLQRGFDDEVFHHRAAQRTVGHVAGQEVVVANAARLRELRQGYDPRPVDLHDLGQLDKLQEARP